MLGAVTIYREHLIARAAWDGGEGRLLEFAMRSPVIKETNDRGIVFPSRRGSRLSSRDRDKGLGRLKVSGEKVDEAVDRPWNGAKLLCSFG